MTWRRAILAIGGASLLCAAGAADVRDRGAALPFVLGVQTHFSQGWPAGLLAAAKDVHAPALRDSLPWAAGEVRPGVYDFAGANARPLAAACAARQDLLLTLVPKNPLYEGGQLVATADGQHAFARYVNALADRFGNCLVGIEVGNEINNPGNFRYAPGVDPVAAYVALLRTLRADVKPRHARLAILGGSTNAVGTGFIARLAAAGMLDAVDGVVVHPYRSHPENLDFELAHLNATMRRFGPPPPIWATEFSDAFRTPDLAAPLLVKSTTMMAAAGVARAYWYALVDQRWFPTMGLLDRNAHDKPAADAFRLMQDRLLPAGRPVRVPGDRLTFIYRFGADRWVMWGAPRPIALHGGHIVVRDAAGHVLPPLTAIGEEPRIVEGATGYTLGQSPVLADSLLQYGAAPWSYLARTVDGMLHPLGLLDDTYATTFASRFYRPLHIGDVAAAPAGDASHGDHAVLRYTAPAAQAATIAACFSKGAGGDGVDVAIMQGDRLLFRGILTDMLRPAPIDVDLAAGATLDFAFGPNQVAGKDAFHYRIRLLRRGATAGAVCP